jgi:hypothetical protein
MSYATYARKSEAESAANSKAASKDASGGLRIGEPNDACEQEADRVADAIMTRGRAGPQWSVSRMSVDSPLRRKCACGGSAGGGGECEECKKKKEMSHSSRGRGTEGEEEVPPIVHEVLRSPGHTLDPATRAFMEPQFGHDFSQVRVHTDAKAAESARAVNALAYTVGRHIAFGSSQCALGRPVGRRLLAHELAHTLQSRNAANDGSDLIIEPTHSGLEAEARTAAQMALHAPTFNSIGLTQTNSRLFRQEGPAPEIELEVPTPEEAERLRSMGVTLPSVSAISADPKNRSDYIDRKVTAVGYGIYVGFLVFCEGLPLPVQVLSTTSISGSVTTRV